MTYLRQRSAWVIALCFLSTAAVFVAVPRVDIYVSSLFFDAGFPASNALWSRVLHQGLTYALVAAAIGVLTCYLLHVRRAKRRERAVDGKVVVYLFLVLTVGAGLIVNVGLKDHFGRARPRDVVEFGGTQRFTPAFVISDQCEKNCSFSSGEAAAGFFALALARALSRRRLATTLAVVFGTMVSIARIASGAHFLSDVLVSFFVMLLVSDLAYHYIIRASQLRPAPTSAT